jgi:hypothetical protein
MKLHMPSRQDLYHLVYQKQYVEAPGKWIKFIGRLHIDDTYPDRQYWWELNTHDCFYHLCQREIHTYHADFTIGYIHPITWQCMVCDEPMPNAAKVVLKLKAMEI